MSTGEDAVVCTPLCQGFLKKRKDKIRLRWVTYWFKLHNTTLFFYTKKHGSTSDLRGQYYLFEVESVHEVMWTWTKNKRYLFEITMKNGKRKVLAAETPDLRQQWICQLLKAMNHHVHNSTEPSSDWEAIPDHMCRTRCSMISSSSSHSQENVALDRRRHSAIPNSYLWTPSMHSAPVIPTSTSHTYIALDMAHYESSQYAEDEVKQRTEVIELENDYDVLPLRKSLHSKEVIYDTPPSNRRASEREHETADSIYDVPKFVFRKKSECVNGETPEIGGLLSDMVACLGGTSAEWVRATQPQQ